MKSFLVFIIMFSGSAGSILAHKESTHQYIVREAFDLLKLYLGSELNSIGAWVGTTQGREVDVKWYNYPHVVSGVWNEDVNDIVYNHGQRIPILPQSWDLHNQSFVSITHFWQPDFPNTKTALIIGDLLLGEYQTARDKVRAYLNGGWEIKLITGSTPLYAKYYGLIDFFNGENKIHIVKKYDISGRLISTDEYLNIDAGFKKAMVYNILGRIAHLLGDMSVPAHVHEDEHGTKTDWYENQMRLEKPDDGDPEDSFVNYWNAERIFREKGGVINPFCGNLSGRHPVEFLMYTTAQISDHFASRRKDGNDNFEDIGEISSVIGAASGPTTKSEYEDDEEDLTALTGIRDATFPYVIRATAGLLYWFLIETKQINSSFAATICDQQRSLDVTNVTLSGSNYMFQAGGTFGKVQVGRILEITNNGDVVVTSTAKHVVFRATNQVRLVNGFRAESGSEVHVYLGCETCSDED